MYHKLDPYTSEIIEFDMSYESPEDDQDSQAAGCCLDPYSFEPVREQVVNYQNWHPWVQYSINERLGAQLSEYLITLRHLSNEEFAKAKSKAIAEAQAMTIEKTKKEILAKVRAEIQEVPVWNHIPQSADEESKRRVMNHTQSVRLEAREKCRLTEEFTMSNSALVDQIVGEAVGKAVRHAERISKRDHIMADRVERVNLFITSLRRELGSIEKGLEFVPGMSGNLVSSLCRKDLWHDAGVLNLNLTGIYSLKFGRDQIQKWIDIANRQRNSIEAARYQIEGDLEELERGLTGALTAVQDAQQVNQESELVSTGLCQLFA